MSLNLVSSLLVLAILFMLQVEMIDDIGRSLTNN